MHDTFAAHLIDSFTIIYRTFGELIRLSSSSLCNFLQPPFYFMNLEVIYCKKITLNVVPEWSNLSYCVRRVILSPLQVEVIR